MKTCVNALTGALLLFRFANQTIYEMTGNFNPKTLSFIELMDKRELHI